MGKIWILLLLYSYCFSGCEATVNGEQIKKRMRKRFKKVFQLKKNVRQK